MTRPNTPHESDALNDALAALYCGPLEDFIRARDALAKELRSSGNRDAATAVKAARKPSRLAWALNAGVRTDSAALAGLEDAVALTLQAQAEGGDVRAAMGVLRAAVRDLARAGEAAARRAGQSVDAVALSTAVLAVLGTPDSFDRLRLGLLTDIPEAGGLDFLASLPAPPSPAARTAPATPAGPVATSDSDAEDRARAARAAEALAAATAAAAAAAERERAALADLSAAETRFRQAQADLEAARQRHELACREGAAAATGLQQAQAEDEAARRRLDR